MSEIDKTTFDKVVLQYPEIKASLFERVIQKINKSYSGAKRRKKSQIDFEKLRDKALEYCDLFNLFEHELYKSAVGKYYGIRNAQRFAELKEMRKQVGKPSEITLDAVTIRATIEVSIRFRTHKKHGHLEFGDIDNGPERILHIGNDREVASPAFRDAKEIALGVLNSRRK